MRTRAPAGVWDPNRPARIRRGNVAIVTIGLLLAVGIVAFALFGTHHSGPAIRARTGSESIWAQGATGPTSTSTTAAPSPPTTRPADEVPNPLADPPSQSLILTPGTPRTPNPAPAPTSPPAAPPAPTTTTTPSQFTPAQVQQASANLQSAQAMLAQDQASLPPAASQLTRDQATNAPALTIQIDSTTIQGVDLQIQVDELKVARAQNQLDYVTGKVPAPGSHALDVQAAQVDLARAQYQLAFDTNTLAADQNALEQLVTSGQPADAVTAQVNADTARIQQDTAAVAAAQKEVATVG